MRQEQNTSSQNHRNRSGNVIGSPEDGIMRKNCTRHGYVIGGHEFLFICIWYGQGECHNTQNIEISTVKAEGLSCFCPPSLFKSRHQNKPELDHAPAKLSCFFLLHELGTRVFLRTREVIHFDLLEGTKKIKSSSHSASVELPSDY